MTHAYRATPSARTWPDAVAYREAIQSPNAVLTDPLLACATVATDRLGLPIAYTGRFAVVFRLRDGHGVDWAVRCFTQAAPDAARRYAAIAAHLETLDPATSPFVPFRFLERGIRIGTDWFPIVMMRWATGQPLGRWTEDNQSDPAALRHVADRLETLLNQLEAAGIAHGDWQHDNILVDETGSLTLVDYDGLFVPTLAGEAATEIGHGNYQHPARTAAHFGIGLDRFPCLAITSALRAIAVDPSLWTRFSDGESILFQRGDFTKPAASAIFDAIRSRNDPQLAAAVARLMAACTDGPKGILLDGTTLPSPKPKSDRWWDEAQDQIKRTPVETTHVGTSSATNFLAQLTLPEHRRAETRVLWAARLLPFAVGLCFFMGMKIGFEPTEMALLMSVLIMFLGHLNPFEFWQNWNLPCTIEISIQSENREREEVQKRLLELRREIAERPFGSAKTEAQFIEERLARTDIFLAKRLHNVDVETILALRSAGVTTAADLTRVQSVPGIEPEVMTSLTDWIWDQQVDAMAEYERYRERPLASYQFDYLEAGCRGYERLIRDLDATIADLEAQRSQVPDASFGEFLRRVCFLPRRP